MDGWMENMISTNTGSTHNPTLAGVILIVTYRYIPLKCNHLRQDLFQTCPGDFIHILSYKLIHPKPF